MPRVSGRLRIVIIIMLAAAGVAFATHRLLAPAQAVCVLSGPSVLGFIQTAQGTGCVTVGGTIWALSATVAEPRALFRIDAPIAGTPISSGRVLIAATADGTLCAWDGRDGSRLWQRPFSSPLTAPIAVAEDTVAVPLWPNALAILDERTGAIRGKQEVGAAIRFAPMWWQGRWAVVTRGDELFILSKDGRVLARQPVAGPVLAAAACEEQLWLACAPNRITLYTSTGPGPSAIAQSGISMLHAGGNMVIVAGADRDLTCVITRGAGLGITWRRRLPSPVTSLAGPFAANTKSFWAVGTATGHALLLDADTGEARRTFRVAPSPVLFLALIPPFLACATADGVWLCPLPR
ncbi:MAG: PQQ-like beta-propeller repeat protein [Armatimonadetes bacterium]|nr:PQQ-like beta-propeller repeat protein [Armatimonadota bacterium]